MSVFSKLGRAGYPLEDDEAPRRLGSRAAWSPAPSGNHSSLAERDTDNFSDSPSVQYHYPPHYPGPVLSRPASRYHSRHSHRSHHSHVPEDTRSRSFIDITSDDPDSDSEIIKLRKEVHQLTRMLNTINKRTTETGEEVHKIAAWVLTHPLGVPAGLPPSAPLIDKSKYKYWEQAQWQTARDMVKSKELSVDSPLITVYMEDEDGSPIGVGTKSALHGDLFAYWNGVLRSGEVLTNYKLLDFGRKQDFCETFENKYPWLRLCEAHWKVDHLWINYFASWYKSHGPPGPIPNPNLMMRMASSPINISSSPSPPASDVAVAGSKRAHEESESPDAARKRLKEIREQAFAPTKFHHPPPISKKKAKKLLKDPFPTTPITPSVLEPTRRSDTPVASGSGNSHSSPPPVPEEEVVPATPQQSPSPVAEEVVPATPQLSPPPLPSDDTITSSQDVPTFGPDTLAAVSLPEDYTPPPSIPPTFTLLEPLTKSNSPESSNTSKARISYKNLVREDWVKANESDYESFDAYWATLDQKTKRALSAAKKKEVTGTSK